MGRAGLACLLCACAFAMACGGPASNSAAGGEQKTSGASGVPDDIAAVAHGALGPDGEALAWGDLSMDGRQQVLVVNRLAGAPSTQGDGILVTRMTVVENTSGGWAQILMCDEHLKNGKGYLIGSPGEAISRWKLSFVKDPVKGLILSLTPMGDGSDALGRTLHIRWNPEAMRYQALEPDSDKFSGEISSIEIIHRPLR